MRELGEVGRPSLLRFVRVVLEVEDELWAISGGLPEQPE